MAEKQPSPLPESPSVTAVMQHLLGALFEVVMEVVLSSSWSEFCNRSVSHPLLASRADKITVLIKGCIYCQNFLEPSLGLSLLGAECGLLLNQAELWCVPFSTGQQPHYLLCSLSLSHLLGSSFCCSNEVLQVLFHPSVPSCPGRVVSPQKVLCSDPFILCFHAGTLEIVVTCRVLSEILQSHSLCVTDQSDTVVLVPKLIFWSSLF